jgi:biotin synthase
MDKIQEIFSNSVLEKDQLEFLLNLNETDQKHLFKQAAKVKEEVIGNKVYFRGLIEFSNICAKDCFYCGIRKSNRKIDRYNLSDEEIIDASVYAKNQNFGSIVLQAGEIASKDFIRRIDNLLKKIHQKTNDKLRVTLSLGEQSFETYKHWFESGAHRYLLRIETTNENLYRTIHPGDTIHSFGGRLRALESLKEIGYQTGTGVMIGLPFQKTEDLVNDLLFMKEFEIDMVGMGPYIEHTNTPLYQLKNHLWHIMERFNMSLKMIGCLRILMPKINIAAATALQAIDKIGREKAIRAGANVIMPNITPGQYRDSYKLYDNKPCTDENTDDCTNCLNVRIGITGNQIGFGEWGDSEYYYERAVIAKG